MDIPYPVSKSKKGYLGVHEVVQPEDTKRGHSLVLPVNRNAHLFPSLPTSLSYPNLYIV